MRTILLFAAIVGVALPCCAQDAPTSTAAGERLAVGGLLTPALEGGGAWFMPGLRVSVPLGSRHGLDVDAGLVFGATNKYGSIRRYHTVQLCFDRPSQDRGSVRSYWLAGVRHLPEIESDGRRKHHTALAIGRGWSEAFSNGTRVVGEIGFSGGDGFMVYVTTGVQWSIKKKGRV